MVRLSLSRFISQLSILIFCFLFSCIPAAADQYFDNIYSDAVTINNASDNSVLFAGPDGIVSDDATNFHWDYDNKRLGIGVAGSENTVTIGGVTVGSTLSVHAEGSTDLAEFSVHRHSDTAAFGSHFIGVRSRGTESSETAVQSNDVLLRLDGLGHDGTDHEIAAQIDIEAVGS